MERTERSIIILSMERAQVPTVHVSTKWVEVFIFLAVMQGAEVSFRRLSAKGAEMVTISLTVKRAEVPLTETLTEWVEMPILIAVMERAEMTHHDIALIETARLD